MSDSLNMVSRGSGGTPALFAHSFAGDCSHWGPSLEHLQISRRVVAFDFSGHGLSPAARGRYSIKRLAEDILAVANTQNLEQFALVGHSLGAFVAAEFAGAYPQRVKMLILVDAPPAPGAMPPEMIHRIRDALEKDPYPAIEQFWNQQPFVGARPETQRRLLAALRKIARNAAIELTEDLLAFDATAPLRHYAGPKFAIVTPNNDTPLSLQHAVDGFEYATIDGTSHWIHLDRPDEFNRVLDRFLRR